MKTKPYLWKGPGDQKRFQIDYSIVKQRIKNSIRDMKTLPGVKIDSICIRSANRDKSKQMMKITGKENVKEIIEQKIQSNRLTKDAT